MEHIIITTLPSGMLRLSPEEGYILYNDKTCRSYAEAVVKTAAGWRAVLSGIEPQPHERTLEDAKREKLHALALYDASPAVNSFSIGGKQQPWIAPDERANFLNTIQGERRLGGTTVNFQGITLPLDMAENILDRINRYARQCWEQTEAHADAINAKRKIETVDAYDFTVGYPEKLAF